MICIPILPLDTTARELVDFCLSFQTVAGFIQVFEEKWQQLGGEKQYMGAAYESTEQLYTSLLNRGRRFKDREVFYSARSRHYSQES
ncbi:hypothetical protein GO755_30505 [Spirosoma sp. HMF4905]|uniref:Uncharacterized protein n=1 Tax=Spirosoma arboris TaxID=2682092 RepID=A0A7K1SL35_9BACT|nr:hypothetical protein [Spirosoma arboris]MVM34403.1 hypothetical protein [Spirosoma arboris]